MSNIAIPEVRADRAVNLLARLDALFERISQRTAMVAVLAVLTIAFANVTDIILRNFFGRSLYGLNEINVLLVAIAVSACMPSGMAGRAALSVEILESRVSAGVAAWLKAFGASGLCLFLGLLSWRVGDVALHMSQNNQTTIMTSIQVASFFWAVAVALAAATCVQLLVTLRAAFEARLGTPRWGNLILLLGAVAMALATLLCIGVLHTSLFYDLLPRNPLLLSAVMFALMWVAIMMVMPLGAAMGLTGLLGTAALLGLAPALQVLGAESKSYISQNALSVLPLFLLMGAFASVAGIGTDIYRLAYAMMGHLRGGLAHASIAACAGFGTLTGSSMATQMTIGRIALPEMRARGYSPELASGAIAAGGTLGQLVPPASALILYAVMTEQSVNRLFIGAIVPGILATLLYMGTVTVWLWLHPEDAPRGEKASWISVARIMRSCWAAMLLLAVVLGGIYAGLFTELEAGSVGAAGAFLLAVSRGRINRETFWSVMAQTTTTMAMMYSLLFGTLMLSFFFGIAHLPQYFLQLIATLNLSPLGLVIALVLCYLILGTAMDSWAMMVITVPIFVPLVVSVGYDPIWWGVMTVICMEAGQISPPFGLNMFMISSLAPDIPIMRVFRGCWPFFGSTCVKILLLIAIPALVTWLPNRM